MRYNPPPAECDGKRHSIPLNVMPEVRNNNYEEANRIPPIILPTEDRSNIYEEVRYIIPPIITPSETLNINNEELSGFHVAELPTISLASSLFPQ